VATRAAQPVTVTHAPCATSSRLKRGGLVVLGTAALGGVLFGVLYLIDAQQREQQGTGALTASDFLSQNPLLIAGPVLAGLPIAFWLAAEPQC